MTKFSILHISDLHKLEGTNYQGLLQSLLTDRDDYMAAGVPNPKYVVVSGDLIHGGDTVDEIRAQYSETKGFLEEIVNPHHARTITLEQTNFLDDVPDRQSFCWNAIVCSLPIVGNNPIANRPSACAHVRSENHQASLSSYFS